MSGEEGEEGLLHPLGLADLLAEDGGLVEDGAFVELLERQRLDEEQDALEGSLEQLIYTEREEENVGEPSQYQSECRGREKRGKAPTFKQVEERKADGPQHGPAAGGEELFPHLEH